MTGNQFLTTGNIAQRRKVNPSTVHRWVEAGLLVPVTVVNGVRLFTEAEVERFENERAAS